MLKHAVEDLPIAASNRHCAVGGHADHCLHPVNDVQILGIVDASAGLDDISGKGIRDPVGAQMLGPSHGYGIPQSHLMHGFAEIVERVYGGGVHLQKWSDRGFHESGRSQR